MSQRIRPHMLLHRVSCSSVEILAYLMSPAVPKVLAILQY